MNITENSMVHLDLLFLGIHDTVNIFWRHYQRMEKILTIGTIIVPEWTWWLGASPWICLVYQLLRLWGTELRQAFLKGFSFFPLLFFSFCIFVLFSPPPPHLFFVWLYHMACRILVPNQGPKTCLPCTRSSVLTTGIAREVPWKLFLVLNRHYTKNPEVYHRYCLYSCTEWSVIHK